MNKFFTILVQNCKNKTKQKKNKEPLSMCESDYRKSL